MMPPRPTSRSSWQALAAPCDGHGSASGGAGDDVRCSCGSLLARWTAAGVELKCRRCKRHVVLPLDGPPPPRAPPDV